MYLYLLQAYRSALIVLSLSCLIIHITGLARVNTWDHKRPNTTVFSQWTTAKPGHAAQQGQYNQNGGSTIPTYGNYNQSRWSGSGVPQIGHNNPPWSGAGNSQFGHNNQSWGGGSALNTGHNNPTWGGGNVSPQSGHYNQTWPGNSGNAYYRGNQTWPAGPQHGINNQTGYRSPTSGWTAPTNPANNQPKVPTTPSSSIWRSHTNGSRFTNNNNNGWGPTAPGTYTPPTPRWTGSQQPSYNSSYGINTNGGWQNTGVTDPQQTPATGNTSGGGWNKSSSSVPLTPIGGGSSDTHWHQNSPIPQWNGLSQPSNTGSWQNNPGSNNNDPQPMSGAGGAGLGGWHANSGSAPLAPLGGSTNNQWYLGGGGTANVPLAPLSGGGSPAGLSYPNGQLTTGQQKPPGNSNPYANLFN